MNQIKNLEDLIGKTIDDYFYDMAEECFIMIFKDKSYMHISTHLAYEDAELCFEDTPSNLLKMNSGLISQMEFNEFNEAKEKIRRENVRKCELDQLKQLQEKYKDTL